MELYQYKKEENILELDLGEEAGISTQHLAMAIYYSQKSFNPRVLITEMLNAWGIQKGCRQQKKLKIISSN
jgi:hypothetical protein